MIEVEVLGEAYLSLKQYIPAKDRQEAADTLMSIMVDSMTDDELKVFSEIDSKLAKAYKEYAADDDEDDDYNREDDE